jgi:F-type H+-transporting ATPase subunit delta
MARTIPGKRYAQAAFELAVERDELEGWKDSLKRIAELTKDVRFLALMESPKLPFSAKKGLLEERLVEVNALALNLACLLTSRGRLGLANNISQEYDRLVDAYHGIQHAEVVTALHLDDEDKERLSRQLGEIMKGKVMVDAQVDPSIIGGFIARVGDTLIDGSIRNRLEVLRDSLAEGSK